MAKKLSRRAFLGLGAAAVGVAALEFSACAQNSQDADAGDKSEEDSPKDVAISAALATETADFNPVGATSALAIAANRHVLEGLYDVDMTNYRINAAIADGEPVKVGETEYEIKIKADKKFSNGDALTVKDVVNAFEKNMADSIIGPFLGFIERVQQKDDLTVSFKFKYQFDSLLKSRLSLVKIFPAGLGEDALKTKPLGSGPWVYEVANGADAGSILFEKNPYYAGNSAPENEDMKWRIIKDDALRAKALTDGDVMAIDGVVAGIKDEVTSGGKTIEYVPGFACPFLVFNTKKAPFDEVDVRQAFFYALDVDKMIADKFDSHAKPISCFLPETYPNYHQSATVFSFDAQKAKDLLKGARLKNTAVELLVDDTWSNVLADQIKENLSAVGIEAEIKTGAVDWAAIGSGEEGASFDVVLTAGDPSVICNDPDFLMSWWYGDNAWMRTRSGWAETKEWQDLQVKLQSARVENDPNKQQAAWNECFDIVSKNCPLYPLFFCDVATAYDAGKLSSFSPIATAGLDFLGAKALNK